jgi:hypothetical protein
MEPCSDNPLGYPLAILDKTFLRSAHPTYMSILDQMNSSELEALAANLHTQIDRGSNHSEMPKVELEDVKGWLALRKKAVESCSELSFFLNLV